MRIAIVTDYSLDLIGGAQRAALNEAAALAAAGHEVVFVGPRPTRDVLPAGVEACWTDAPRLPGLDFPLAVDGEALRRQIGPRLARVDAVHLHAEFGHAAAATAIARRRDVPVVHTIHTAYWPAVPAPLIPVARTLLARLAGPAPRRTANPLLDHTIATALTADVVLSPSTHQAADLATHGVDALVLPNCDAARAEPIVPLPADGPLRVAWIGRCVPEKRLLTFVRAVRVARRALPAGALNVAIAGDGVLLPAARRMGSGIDFLGRLDPPAVRHLIDGSHVTALTSHGFDNQPMTVVESVRAGRGVLHTDPRLREGMDPSLLAASADARGVADLLVELATEPGRVHAAAAAARRAALLFAPETFVARLVPLLAGAESRVGV